MAKIIIEENNDFYFNTTSKSNVINYKHHHPMYEIYYLEQGVCHYLIEGKLFELIQGDVVFIPKGHIHKTSYDTAHSRLLINCSEEYLSGVVITDAFVFRNEKYTKEIYRIFKEIEKEYLQRDDFSDMIIKGLIQQLLASVFRNENNYENTRVKNTYIEKALELLEKNYDNEISLFSVAEQLKVSSEHLSRLFKKETGLGFNEYLSVLRLKKAEWLLKQDDQVSISEIAFACGFNDSNYFCEKFKKVYGVSPLKFRNSFKPSVI